MEITNALDIADIKQAMKLLEQEKNRTCLLKMQLSEARKRIAELENTNHTRETENMIDIIRKNAEKADEINKRICMAAIDAEKDRRERKAFTAKMTKSIGICFFVVSMISAYVILCEPHGVLLVTSMLGMFCGGCWAYRAFSGLMEAFM